jgi:hypothetical protein
MKRHSALIPLSRDHHDGLVQAVLLRAVLPRTAMHRLDSRRPGSSWSSSGTKSVSTFAMRKTSPATSTGYYKPRNR